MNSGLNSMPGSEIPAGAAISAAGLWCGQVCGLNFDFTPCKCEIHDALEHDVVHTHTYLPYSPIHTYCTLTGTRILQQLSSAHLFFSPNVQNSSLLHHTNMHSRTQHKTRTGTRTWQQAPAPTARLCARHSSVVMGMMTHTTTMTTPHRAIMRRVGEAAAVAAVAVLRMKWQSRGCPPSPHPRTAPPLTARQGVL